MRQCTVEGCGRVHRAKGWCAEHYLELRNPLVCQCDNPTVDGIGMCSECKRKPRALMASA